MKKFIIIGLVSIILSIFFLINSKTNITGAAVNLPITYELNSMIGLILFITGLILIAIIVHISGLEERIENKRVIAWREKRVQCSTRKEAYELAKRDSDPGKKPVLHIRHKDRNRPHYHPNVKQKYRRTPKGPNSHDHYYFPKRFI